MTLATMPGQTNFIAQFNTSLRETFGLSHGEFGGIYAVATLASVFLLIWAGTLVDRYSARKLAVASIAGLAMTAPPWSYFRCTSYMDVSSSNSPCRIRAESRDFNNLSHGKSLLLLGAPSRFIRMTFCK